MKFGIDFGTSFSTMCALRSDGRPEVLRDGNGDEKIPSVVYWGKDGIKVGRAAVGILEDAQSMPEEERAETLCRLIKGIKRNLAPGYSIAFSDGKVVMPVDVVSEILRYLKKEAEERHFGETVTEVMLTHPATFTEAQKKLLKEAAKKVGFKTVGLRSEPEAAALGYASICEKKERLGNGILVFDFGGGTFDLAYLRREKDGSLQFPVQPVGSSQCGGDDIDQIVYDWAEKKLQKEKGRSFADGFNIDQIFLAHCCRAKEKLSVNSRASLQEFNTGFSAVLTRDEFNALISSKLDVAMSLVKSMVADLKRKKLSIDGVLLIGGSTRIPLVVERLKEVLPDIKHIHTTKTDTAVVCGSVWKAVKQKLAKNYKKEKGYSSKKVEGESYFPSKNKYLRLMNRLKRYSLLDIFMMWMFDGGRYGEMFMLYSLGLMMFWHVGIHKDVYLVPMFHSVGGVLFLCVVKDTVSWMADSKPKPYPKEYFVLTLGMLCTVVCPLILKIAITIVYYIGPTWSNALCSFYVWYNVILLCISILIWGYSCYLAKDWLWKVQGF